jgi:protein-tyrosine phosphatase
MTERDRLIALEGAMNCRDLGGYPTADGRVTRWGCVYRSDGLDQLSDADLDVLVGLGIRVVFDFRMDSEVDVAPSRLPDHPELKRQRLPIGDAGPGESLMDMLLRGEITEYTVEAVADIYESILDDAAHEFGTVVTAAANPDQHPLLFHCTAGKDRTGLMAMLLLGVLGVPDDVILSDYELTTHYRSGRRVEILRPQLEEAGVNVDAVLPFLTAQAPVMAATIDALRREHGSFERYLVEQATVPPEVIEQARTVLLVKS